jgi:hypothetical protein
MFTYTEAMLDALRLLRASGFAVCAFDPEELGEVDPEEVEQLMGEAGWDFISHCSGLTRV